MSVHHAIVSRLSVCLLLACTVLFYAEAARSERNPSLEGTVMTGTGAAPKLELDTFTVETIPEGVQVDTGFKIDHANVIRAQLRDGAVMNLQCKLKLERVRTLLSNPVISETTRSYQLRHDLLTREFILSSPERPLVRQKQFDALLASTWGHLQFLLPLHEPLSSGETYRVQFDVTLEHAEVPPWLEKALFFWSWEVAPPLSFSQDFVF